MLDDDRIVSIREFESGDTQPILDALMATEEYWLAMTGYFPEEGDLQSLFYLLPDGADMDIKHLYVIELDGIVIGLIDALMGWPMSTVITLGTFLIHPRFQRQGIAARTLEIGSRRARDMGYDTIGAACPHGWSPGESFLSASGFTRQPPHQSTQMNRITHPHERGLQIDAWTYCLHEAG